MPNLHFTGDTQQLPLYRFDSEGRQQDNITDWALEQFRTHYKRKKIQKQDIFHYVYAVLHHPAYRLKYAQHLRRDLPRIPLYDNFGQWVAWGKALMDLHLDYENLEPWPLQRQDADWNLERSPAPRLKANKALNCIEIDEQTQLQGIPAEAWHYKLGNRTAIEWVLDQYREQASKDPIIATRFQPYRLAQYREQLIVLLQRVCRASVETMRICTEMPE